MNITDIANRAAEAAEKAVSTRLNIADAQGRRYFLEAKELQLAFAQSLVDQLAEGGEDLLDYGSGLSQNLTRTINAKHRAIMIAKVARLEQCLKQAQDAAIDLTQKLERAEANHAACEAEFKAWQGKRVTAEDYGVSSWIAVSERMPTREDGDGNGDVLWNYPANSAAVCLWNAENMIRLSTHWMVIPPLPTNLPVGEKPKTCPKCFGDGFVEIQSGPYSRDCPLCKPPSTPERMEACSICRVMTDDWVDPNWAKGRVCRDCESKRERLSNFGEPKQELPAPPAGYRIATDEELDKLPCSDVMCFDLMEPHKGWQPSTWQQGDIVARHLRSEWRYAIRPSACPDASKVEPRSSALDESRFHAFMQKCAADYKELTGKDYPFSSEPKNIKEEQP